MSIDNLNIGTQAPRNMGDFLSMPLGERARFLAEVSEVALKSVEAKAASTIVPDDIRQQGIPATALFLLDEGFYGSPTVGTACHATDTDRGSLKRFEEDVRLVEAMLSRKDVAAKLESNRTHENNHYRAFPGLGIVFRERTLATIERNGVKSILAKRTSAVFNPIVPNSIGGFSYRPQRRDESLHHGARFPDIVNLEQLGEVDLVDQQPVINPAITVDAFTLHIMEERSKSGYASFAGEARNILAKSFGASNDDRHKPPYIYLDVFEHALGDPDRMTQIFDRAMIDAPRANNPAKRGTPWLHVVSSQLYLKDLK